jgi:hypothetical protein
MRGKDMARSKLIFYRFLLKCRYEFIVQTEKDIQQLTGLLIKYEWLAHIVRNGHSEIGACGNVEFGYWTCCAIKWLQLIAQCRLR